MIKYLFRKMTTTHIDIIGSSTSPCVIGHEVELTDEIVAEEGYCLAVRALEDKEVYNQLEDVHGRFNTIVTGTTFVGALGVREALKGYRGRIPESIKKGDKLCILNMGGILGECTSAHPSLGLPLHVEVLGGVQSRVNGSSKAARVQDHALSPVASLGTSAPIIAISGTAMDTGKTRASAAVIRGLTEHGYRVAAAKLTGAALLRDLRAMENNGAVAVSSFSRAGVVTSAGKEIVPRAKAVISYLNDFNPDVIVVELGDGFIGHYGVDDFLMDSELSQFVCADVVAATDLAGAWAADHLFTNRYKRPISVMVGPVTDNGVGSDYITSTLGIPAHNAILDPHGLVNSVIEPFRMWMNKHLPKIQELVA